jgi:phosphoribosylanthranilate isomerase
MTTDDGREALFLPGETRVKVCGVTNAADASMVVAAGADAVGINLFAGSKRFVELGAVKDWVAELPVTRVAVVVNATADELAAVRAAGCFDAVQYHGDETAADCAAGGGRWVRAVRVRDWGSLRDALEYATPYLLLDAFSAAGYGGTGAGVDLEIAAEFVRNERDRRVLLAGGLRPETVAAAVRRVRPHGVDVASGVEVAGEARRKDAGRVREFVAAAKG